MTMEKKIPTVQSTICHLGGEVISYSGGKGGGTSMTSPIKTKQSQFRAFLPFAHWAMTSTGNFFHGCKQIRIKSGGRLPNSEGRTRDLAGIRGMWHHKSSDLADSGPCVKAEPTRRATIVLAGSWKPAVACPYGAVHVLWSQRL
jgi:hypothetical protein